MDLYNAAHLKTCNVLATLVTAEKIVFKNRIQNWWNL